MFSAAGSNQHRFSLFLSHFYIPIIITYGIYLLVFCWIFRFCPLPPASLQRWQCQWSRGGVTTHLSSSWCRGSRTREGQGAGGRVHIGVGELQRSHVSDSPQDWSRHRRSCLHFSECKSQFRIKLVLDGVRVGKYSGTRQNITIFRSKSQNSGMFVKI